ncbi:unnamed protein product, partial [Rotaria socialis]
MWHPALMRTLEQLNMPLQLRRWFFVWSQNHTMTILHGDAESRLIKISLGAPQGSLLAAFLFRLHVHFLPSYFTEITSHLFDDDLTLIIKGALELKISGNLEYLEIQAKSVLKSLEKFAADHILPINVPKTKLMLIHSA